VPIETARAIYESVVEKPFNDSKSPKGAAFISYDTLEGLVIEKLISTGHVVEISAAQKSLTIAVNMADIRAKEAEANRVVNIPFEEAVVAAYSESNRRVPPPLQRKLACILIFILRHNVTKIYDLQLS
jgi:hypothetical protein